MTKSPNTGSIVSHAVREDGTRSFTEGLAAHRARPKVEQEKALLAAWGEGKCIYCLTTTRGREFPQLMCAGCLAGLLVALGEAMPMTKAAD